jgi:hypothetical protein
MSPQDLPDLNRELDALRTEVDKLRCRIEVARGHDRRRLPDRRLTPRQRPDRRTEHRGERSS